MWPWGMKGYRFDWLDWGTDGQKMSETVGIDERAWCDGQVHPPVYGLCYATLPFPNPAAPALPSLFPLIFPQPRSSPPISPNRKGGREEKGNARRESPAPTRACSLHP